MASDTENKEMRKWIDAVEKWIKGGGAASKKLPPYEIEKVTLDEKSGDVVVKFKPKPKK